MNALQVGEYDAVHDSIVIEGTTYSGKLFRELGCNFAEMVGQTLKVVRKENGTVTVARIA